MIDMPSAPKGAHELCVPSEALGLDGAMPETGDEVEFTVRGTVSRTEGGKTYVTASEVNGQPVPVESAEPSEDDLRDMAEDADEAMMGG